MVASIRRCWRQEHIMEQHSRKRTVAGIAALTLALVGVGAGLAAAKGGAAGADTLQAATSTASCSGSTTGMAGFNKSGKAVTISYGASNDTTGGSWAIVVIDNGTPVAMMDSGSIATDWSALLNYSATKGNHAVIVEAISNASGETCSASLSFKV
jgi:hypothetical protein